MSNKWYIIYNFWLRPFPLQNFNWLFFRQKTAIFYIFFILKYMMARIRRQSRKNWQFSDMKFLSDKLWWMKWLSKKTRRVYCTLLLYQGYIFVWFRCNHALWYHIQSNLMRKSDTGRYIKMDLFSYWIKFSGQIHWRYVSSFHSKV